MKAVVNCHGAPETVEVSASCTSLEGSVTPFHLIARLERSRSRVTRRRQLTGPALKLDINSLAVPA